MQAIIELNQANKVFVQGPVSTEALRPTTLSISPGEHVAIVGASGSGKSTLLNLIAGIDRPTKGRVKIDGTDLGGLSEAALSRFRGSHIGIVFQFFELIPTLTALENILLAMEFVGVVPRAERRERAHALLEKVGLADHAGKQPSRLSGGQQQRVAVARALANDPPLLIADEPTGNLDRKNAELVHDLFGHCVAEGRTVIVATHERGDLSRYSRVVHVEDGRIEDGVAA